MPVGTTHSAISNARTLERLHKIDSFAQLPAALCRKCNKTSTIVPQICIETPCNIRLPERAFRSCFLGRRRGQHREVPMKLAVVVAAPCAAVIATTNAMSQTKSEKCAAYVREAARQTPATTRPARGAVRGAIGGAIVGGDIGRGAAACNCRRHTECGYEFRLRARTT
jgi:hypothetical protein